MKTAEEIYMQVQDAECPNANNLTLPEDWQLNAMKEYARKCCEDLRDRITSDARIKVKNSEKLSKFEFESRVFDKENYEVNKYSIRNIEINLP